VFIWEPQQITVLNAAIVSSKWSYIIACLSERVLKFMNFINQESSHHAFVEQFTSMSTKFDHAAGMQEVSAGIFHLTSTRTGGSTVAQIVDYEFVDTDDSAVMLKYKDHTHTVDTEVHTHSGILCCFHVGT